MVSAERGALSASFTFACPSVVALAIQCARSKEVESAETYSPMDRISVGSVLLPKSSVIPFRIVAFPSAIAVIRKAGEWVSRESTGTAGCRNSIRGLPAMADRHAAAYSEAMANFKDAFMVVMTGELMVGVIISCGFLYFYVKNTKSN